MLNMIWTKDEEGRLMATWAVMPTRKTVASALRETRFAGRLPVPAWLWRRNQNQKVTADNAMSQAA